MNSFNDHLIAHIQKKQSRLCVGLDLSPDRMGVSPDDLDALKTYARMIVDTTRDLAAAFKPNLAFFERWGAEGWDWLKSLREYIGDSALVIADAKRGDIGATARHYAENILVNLNMDAITVNPYMGRDAIEPFCSWPEKGVFVLCRTSNPSGDDLQTVGSPDSIYSRVATMADNLNYQGNVGLVVGATVGDDLKKIRELAPELPFLIPGVGAQGGSIRDALSARTADGEIVVNVSRSIITAGDRSANAIREAAENYRNQLNQGEK